MDKTTKESEQNKVTRGEKRVEPRKEWEAINVLDSG